jgi:hypothetical protein
VELKYKDLYENAPAMFASVDHQTGLIIDCNQQLIQKQAIQKRKLSALMCLKGMNLLKMQKMHSYSFKKRVN